MRRIAVIAISVLLAIVVAMGAKPKRTSGQVRRERQKTEQQLKQTAAKVKANEAETRRELNRLDALKASMALRGDTIAALQGRIDVLNTSIARLNDSIEILDRQSKALQKNYSATLRTLRTRRQGMSDLAFIFSSESFSQAWARIRYLRQMAKAVAETGRQVRESAARLESARAEMAALREGVAADLAQQKEIQNKVNAEKTAADKLVSTLRKQGRALDREMQRRQAQANALAKELDRIVAREAAEAAERERKAREEEQRRIAEQRRKEEAEKRKAEELKRKQAEAEQRKKDTSSETKKPAAEKTQPTKKTAETVSTPTPKTPTPQPKAPESNRYASEAAADRALSGSFEANKGRLLFPVAGKYTITGNFGTYSHPELSRVKVDNLGIDIDVPAGTNARAVFEGVVSTIFRVDGYRNIIIVRHGEYLTVYAGIDRLSVKKGDKVKAGQSLGAIYVNPDNDNRSMLHFEIRHEKQKLNPVDWVK